MNGSKRGVAPNDGADLTPSDDSSQPSDRDHSPRRVEADHTDHQGHLDHQDHPRGFGPRSHRDPLCRVVLVEPLIPENTGNISRTCVATNSELHLVEPMGFEISESRVKRAGLDYWADLAWQKHESTAAWRNSLPHGARVFLIETSGRRDIFEVEFQRGDWIVFGKETTGLSPTLLTGADAIPNAQVLSIPMPGTTRSLNLSNAVAVTVFELLRQTRTNR